MSESFLRSLGQRLQARKSKGLYRELTCTFDNLIDLSSNDYLSIARSRESLDQLISILGQEQSDLYFGSTGSRLLSGNHSDHEELESELADFHGHQAALLFSSGYAANVGILSCLPSRHDTVLYDELVHASLRDGIRLSHAKSYSFRHNDLEDLQAKLRNANGQVFVVVESLYSVDGDIAPLGELATWCEAQDCVLMVDEAHATGVFGESGRGIVSQLGLGSRVPVRVHTFGKALGFQGAVAIVPRVVRDYLVNFCRSFIYSTAPSLIDLRSVKLAYTVMKQANSQRRAIFSLVEIFREHVQQASVECSANPTPLQSIFVPGNVQCRKVAQNIRKGGFEVFPILSPTVPDGRERIRICLHAHNTAEEIEQLFNLLSEEAYK